MDQELPGCSFESRTAEIKAIDGRRHCGAVAFGSP
jgi:hypothetical protein